MNYNFISILFFIFITIKLVSGLVRKTHSIELTVDSGSIRGEYLTIGAHDYAVFKGVPYAAPPVGSLRFQKPEPPAKWRGVMNATQYPSMCAQKPRTRETDPVNVYRTHISEDCLYINIFAPPQFTNNTYPVMVFIHGGNFQRGSSADFPQDAILNNFVSRKIIFISFNYRLGPLGFLSTGDEVLPGNVGLWDMIMALKWVKTNAHVFGGDPNNIMISGHGSGAAAASLLAISPKTEGLFEKIFLMSGTGISPGIVRNTAINATWRLQEKLNCRSFNSSEIFDCLSKHVKDELLDVDRTFYDDYEEFVPIVDGDYGVIPEDPEVLASYRPKIPIMLGTTKDESSLRIVILKEKEINLTFMEQKEGEKFVHNLTHTYPGFINHPLISEGCKHEYVWSKINPEADEKELPESILKMYSHFWYDAPTSRLASYYVKQKVPVYLYSFDHISENFAIDRAFHGIDEIFLFEMEPKFLQTRRDRNWQIDRRVTEIFAELIINFLKYNDPTPEISGFTFNWTSMDSETISYLSITDSPSMSVGFRWDGHIFWNWYARYLDAVDVGNLQRIAQLDKQLGDYQLATWMLLFSALFFFAILVGLACYCTRKDSEDEDDI
ncbi:Carboxylesterase, type B domain-containing protein [Strongyloides ratti]|uniref:Carboxylesterase, type B domain-containing protein n=1 Tax=Strongyloides ratti TaxID=34506 RepID=A0A090LKY5_STRRB|nr:Carboxylesterase, type B domain-containing protein [Strongyloides ratti]CEF70375.1 Carboxylesterase, type B domain-containing protein [Strongyloides ratti]